MFIKGGDSSWGGSTSGGDRGNGEVTRAESVWTEGGGKNRQQHYLKNANLEKTGVRNPGLE